MSGSWSSKGTEEEEGMEEEEGTEEEGNASAGFTGGKEWCFLEAVEGSCNKQINGQKQ